MFINIQLSQGTDINLEFALLWQRIAEPVIQIHEFPRSPEYRPYPAGENRLYILCVPVLKLKTGSLYPFSIPRSCKHIFVKLLHINRFQTLKILFPKLIQQESGCSVNEIIIHCDRMRFHSMRSQLNRQPV